MPASLDFEAAAGVPLTALTAWQVSVIPDSNCSLAMSTSSATFQAHVSVVYHTCQSFMLDYPLQ